VKKVLTLIVVVGLMVGLVKIGIGSWAFFSDTEASNQNSFSAGTWQNNPSLSLDPDDAEKETNESSVSHSIWVTNSGDEPKDLAKNVELGVTIVKGEEYVNQILYDPVIGDIEPGGEKEFFLTVKLTGWENAPEEAEVKLKIEVTREDNWPEHNVGKRAHFTIIKGD
jgi:predicted ribosomally synthesized peptide with SipW-like signal peptide